MCDNGVFNWEVFICLKVFFASLFLHKKLLDCIFLHPIFFGNRGGMLIFCTLFFFQLYQITEFHEECEGIIIHPIF